MANDVEITITADGSGAEAGIGKVRSSFQGMKDSIVKNRKAIGLGITALGVGMEGLAKSQQGLTESTLKLASATGLSEDEIRGMASSLSNATFPLESALELMTLGAQQGLESADALKEYATFWDTVGDATGLSAEALAKAGAALAAVGVEVGNETELLGAFGLITREGTGSVQEFLDGIGKMAPELSAMGISVNEAAVVMTALEKAGIKGRIAQTEFRKAMEKSETGLAGVLEQLGLSEEQYATYQTQLEDLTGVMAEEAEAFASTRTVMDKMKSSLSDLVFENGKLIEKASAIAPIFMAAGPAVAGFSGIMGIMTPVLHGAKLAFIGLNLSMGPITLIIIGIGVAIAAAILIWKNWDKIILVLKATLEILKSTFKTVFDFIKDIVKKVFGIITDVFNSKLMWLLPHGALIKAILFIKDNWDEIWNGIVETFTLVSETLSMAFTVIRDAIIDVLQKALDKLKATWEIVFNFIKKIVKTVFDKITEVFNSKLGWLLPGGALIKAIQFLRDNWDEIWNGIKATFTTVTDALVSTFETVKEKILGIWAGIKGGILTSVNAIIGIINGVIRGINNIKIKIPGWDEKKIGKKVVVPGWSGITLKLPRIPTIDPIEFAKGGIVNRPTLAMLGESGPEAVVPLGRGGMGITVNITIAGDVLGMEDFEQKVTSVVRDAVLGGGFQGVLARA